MSPQIDKISLPSIHKIIAVASGKGGVGKSTVAFGLAQSLAQKGYKVGILDADIYGPSLPLLMGKEGQPEFKDQKLIPHELQGIKTMSMGYLIQNGPLIWRGPMVQTAVKQLFKDVEWGALDVLLVDMPPGTGDVHLTLAQNVSMTGAVIVSTPAEIAWLDAQKCLKAFMNLGVSILGVIENMRHLDCPHCQGTVLKPSLSLEKRALEEKVSYLGAIPFLPHIMEGGVSPGGDIFYEKIVKKLGF